MTATLAREVDILRDDLDVLMVTVMPGAKFTRDAEGRIVSVER